MFITTFPEKCKKRAGSAAKFARIAEFPCVCSILVIYKMIPYIYQMQRYIYEMIPYIYGMQIFPKLLKATAAGYRLTGTNNKP